MHFAKAVLIFLSVQFKKRSAAFIMQFFENAYQADFEANKENKQVIKPNNYS